jgi:sensor c-di-GMP phosphodiesterase-like protein
MRHRILLGLAMLGALSVTVAVPWMAWREAQRQATDAESDIALGYARDVLHRADKTLRQVGDGIRRLVRSGHAPCSAAAQEEMRLIDLTSTYIQAIGHVQGNVMICSSASALPIPLGPVTFHTSSGTDLYSQVPVRGAPGSLMAMRRGPFAALVHRDLPLDIGTAVPGISVAVLHLERPLQSPTELSRGHVDRRWLARLGTQRSVTFIDGDYLVAVALSSEFLIAGVAAVPVTHLAQRSRAIAQRLIPAGVVAGLALATAILLLARRRMSLPAALRYALRHKELFLEYQPIVELASGRWVGVEALMRWRRRDTGELIGPDLFIAVAEKYGLMHQVTRRLLRLVEEDTGQYLANHPGFHVALNLSPADIHSDDIVSLLDGFLSRTGACAANLIIEITERGFLDMASARGTLAALHSRGFDIAIDDFGTGYSSLSYLETLDLDFLKIDRSFIEAIGTRAPTSQVVGHIIAMAGTMGLRMIAEGIERPQQADFLVAQGVQYGQGWLYAKALPFADVLLAMDERSGTSVRAASG